MEIMREVTEGLKEEIWILISKWHLQKASQFFNWENQFFKKCFCYGHYVFPDKRAKITYKIVLPKIAFVRDQVSGQY